MMQVQVAESAETKALQALSAGDVDTAEKELLALPQVDCPVMHRFGPGLYIREVTVPAGTLAIGHYQKQKQLNIFLKGKVRILRDDGSTSVLEAPMIFTGEPGRKVGYVLEEMVWQNIWATEETDIEKLEAMFLDKSEGWKVAEAAGRELMAVGKAADRDDYEKALRELGTTEAAVRAESEATDDLAPWQEANRGCKISPSPIEGLGMFASRSFAPWELIAVASIGGKRTPAGRYVNHSASPNAVMVPMPDGRIDLVAVRKIEGCKGGADGDEITVDYRYSRAAVQYLLDKGAL